MQIVVGTRGSKLALAQTNWVISELQKFNVDCQFEIKVIQTKGDLIQNIALHKIGDKGIFVKEIEEQLLNKSIDIAIHSLKDMPSELTKGLIFTPIPKRENRQDILILRQGAINDLSQIKKNAVIATGSKRRKAQLLEVREDFQIVPIRGNIDTRIKKMYEQNLDGIVLASAGLRRIKLEDKISFYLPENLVIPAPAQGALGIQIRQDDHQLYQVITPIKNEIDNLEVCAERAFLREIKGNCNIPIGATAHYKDGILNLTGLLGNENKLVRKNFSDKVYDLEEADKLGKCLAKLILKEF
ncbi:MAG: hydroxymethylbilane synthase [Epulopiscium sp. Nele67-Bin005]|nr:MAG: hydroxymethylbilane synthase [Epulopiscium sp. Nele67-Bin005]